MRERARQSHVSEGELPVKTSWLQQRDYRKTNVASLRLASYIKPLYHKMVF